MKIDEVMLGDIVSAGGRPIHVTLAVLNHWSDNIEPIPLTPEILEKNGFEKNELIESCNHYCGMDNRVLLNDDFYYINSRDVWSVHIGVLPTLAIPRDAQAQMRSMDNAKLYVERQRM